MNKSSINLYEILHVSPTASASEIRKSFYKLSMENHPDKNPGHEEDYKRITAAYDILKDEDKRKKYDLYGDASIDHDFNQIFRSNMFAQSLDINITLNLTLEEAYCGCTKHINGYRENMCKKCSGRGGTLKKCKFCDGSGLIQNFSVCSKCFGSGNILKEKCSKCDGKKTTREKFDYEVVVPPRSNGVVCIKKIANWHPIRRGDLYIKILILKHDKFILNKNDIIYAREISLPEAICGFNFKLKYLDGEDLSIRMSGPMDLKNDYYYIPNKGFDDGNLIIKLILKLPSMKLEELQKIFLISDNMKKRIQDTSGQQLLPYRPKTKNFADEKINCMVQ